MSSIRRPVFHPSLLAILVGLIVSRQSDAGAGGGIFELEGELVAEGGTSTGGVFNLSGTVPVNGSGVSTGGTFAIRAGLDGTPVVPGGPVVLAIDTTPDGHVSLSWPADVTGYDLESTATPAAGNSWQTVAVPTGTSAYTTSALQAARFYRLHRR